MAKTREAQPDDLVQGLHVLTRIALTFGPICLEEGLTVSQYRYLFLIAEEPLRAGALAAAFEVSKPMVAQSIGALEPMGLVIRKPVPGDRRGVEIHITRKGRALLARVERALLQLLHELAGVEAADRLLRDTLAFQGRLDKSLQLHAEGEIDPILHNSPRG